MASNYTTLPTRGHIVGRASEKKTSTWRVIAEIVAYVVDRGVTKKWNVTAVLKTRLIPGRQNRERVALSSSSKGLS